MSIKITLKRFKVLFTKSRKFSFQYINQAEPGAWTYASIGITNAGIIRVGMGVGNITLDDLSSSHPYENTVDTFEIRGADLRQALEISASNYGTVNFLQLSGQCLIDNPLARTQLSVIR